MRESSLQCVHVELDFAFNTRTTKVFTGKCNFDPIPALVY